MKFNAAHVPAKMGTFSQYQYPHAFERYVECANFLGIAGKNDQEKFDNFLKAIEDLKAAVGIKKTIAEYGVDEKYFIDNLDAMVEQAFDDQPKISINGRNEGYVLKGLLRKVRFAFKIA